jgi:hypothetical protein
MVVMKHMKEGLPQDALSQVWGGVVGGCMRVRGGMFRWEAGRGSLSGPCGFAREGDMV